MALKLLITEIDTNNAAKAFGVVGSVLINARDIKNNKVPIAANDAAVSYEKQELNSKKLISIIDQLSIMDDLFKQKLDNQKKVYQNKKLSDQEDKIENNKQLEKAKDAEKVGSSASLGFGLLGLFGLGLLAYDPILGVIKKLADFTLELGNFIGDIVTELTNFFKDFLPDGEKPEEIPEEELPSPDTKAKNPSLREQADASPIRRAPAKPPANPAATPASPAKPVPSLREQAERAGKPRAATPPPQSDKRNWWERNAPSWAGGKPDPNAPAEPAEDKPKATGESYVKPVDVPINSKYGWRKKHPVSGKTAFHHGVDMAAPKGTPVKATKSGKVILANNGNWHGYGKTVAIEHADGYNSIYSHLSKILCKVGDDVKQGQIIGEVGRTGVATGDHLHFMLQKGALQAPSTKGPGYGTVDPKPLLTGSAVAIPASSEPMEEEPGQSSQSMPKRYLSGMPERLTKAATEAADNTLTNIAEFIGTVGGVAVGPGTIRDLTTASPDFAKMISSEAASQTAEIAKMREAENVKNEVSVVSPPNISPPGSSTVENMPSMADRNSVEYYLIRFGYIETNRPIEAA